MGAVRWDIQEMSVTTRDGVTEATRNGHLRMLRLTQDVIRQSKILTLLALDDAMTRSLEYLQEKLHWAASTTIKHAATIVGAWPRLTQYSTVSPTLIRMERYVLPTRSFWKDAMRTMTRAAVEHPVNFPTPLTRAEMARINVHLRARDLALFAFSLCAWHSAARLGDLASMEAGEITLSDDGHLDFRFRRGKGVTARRTAYHVFSAVNVRSEEFKLLTRFLNEVTTVRIWPSESEVERRCWGTRLRDEIRIFDPKYSQRSYRRGAIQAMSQSGLVSNDELLMLSGHSRLVTMRKYLSNGSEEMFLAKSMRAHAIASIATSCGLTEP
jgi:hypothetical protein